MTSSLSDAISEPDFGGLSYEKQEDGSYLVDTEAKEEAEESSYNLLDNSKDNFYRNLVDEIDPVELMNLGRLVRDTAIQDEQSRADWTKTLQLGFDLLGLKVEEKNKPFPGACSAQHPLLLESAVKFQSKASNELLPANGPVRTKVLGDPTLEKELRANKIKAHMNYQITECMTEFYTDAERMLLYVPLFGSAFKKVYYDAYLERPVSEFVPANQLIVPNNSTDLYRAERYTHVFPKSCYQLESDFASGFYKKPDNFSTPTQPKLDPLQRSMNSALGFAISAVDQKDTYNLYEQHGLYCIPGLDAYKGSEDYDLASPYIVTINSDNGEVLGVRRNWKKEDEKRCKKVQFVHYQFVPGFDFYGLGFIHLLGNLQLTLTATMRSLVDAGQFANLQGGFKLKGVRIVNDGDPVAPGQFKDIDAAVMDINKAIMPFNFKEPSGTLFQMLQFVDTKGQKFADSTEQVIQDSTNQGPVGTTLALLDASTKFFGAIHKRLHASLKQELRIIAEINSETLEDDLEYNLENQTMKISREDYESEVDVVPVSDPNISSNAHRMAKAQTMLQIAQAAPQFHDMREVLKHVYINMDYADIDKILPQPKQAVAQDPISDLQSARQGLPIQAFPGQDHESHIQIKQSFLQQPEIMNNPALQNLVKTLYANIQEHMVAKFAEEVQAMSQQGQGMVPVSGAGLASAQGQPQQSGPPSNGAAGQQSQAVDPMIQAAQKVAQMNIQKAQAQAQQGQNDPRVQASMMTAHATMMNAQTNSKKVDLEAQIRQAELQLEKDQLSIEHLRELGKQHGIMQKEVNQSALLDKKHAHSMEHMMVSKGLDMTHDAMLPDNSQRALELKHKDKLKPQMPRS